MALKVQPTARGSEILDINIVRQDGAGRVTMRSPAGEQEGVLRLSVAGEDVALALSTATQLTESTTRRGNASGLQDPLRDLGITLFDALFEGSREGLYRRVMAYARQKGVRIVLRIHCEDPYFGQQPWEFMHDGQDFVCLSDWSAVVRAHGDGAGHPMAFPAAAYRMLVVAADVTGLMEAGDEIARLNALVGQHTQLQVNVVQNATKQVFLDALGDETYDVVHIIGTGVDTRGGAQALALMPDPNNTQHKQAYAKGSSRRVEYDLLSAEEVRTSLLDAQPDLRLVVFSACRTDVLAGVLATTFPAVVGMRGDISTQACIMFAEELYRGLIGGRRLEESVAMARQEIDLRLTGSREWGLPVAWAPHVDQTVWTPLATEAFEGISFAVGSEEESMPAPAGHEAAWHKYDVLARVFTMNLEALDKQRSTYVDSAPKFLESQITDMQTRLEEVRASQRELAGAADEQGA